MPNKNSPVINIIGLFFCPYLGSAEKVRNTVDARRQGEAV